jgi:hypothetical protein
MARESARTAAANLDIFERLPCLKGTRPLDTRGNSKNF